MPILIMGLAALAVFLVLGGVLFIAGMSERRQERTEGASKPSANSKAA